MKIVAVVSLRTVIFLSAVGLVAAHSAVAEVPDLIHGKSSAIPIWVSEAAFTADGEMHWELMEPNAEVEIRDHLAKIETWEAASPEKSAEKCQLSTGLTFAPAWVRRDLATLVANAETIHSGLVMDSKQGFYAGGAGTLLEIRIDTVLKNTRASPLPERVLLFYRIAQIKLGRHYFCAAARFDLKKPPVGKRVVWLEFHWPPGDDEIRFPTPSMVLFEDEESRLVVAPSAEGVKASGATKLLDLEALIARSTIQLKGGRDE